MQKKLNNSGIKYGNQKNITKSGMDKQHGKRVRRIECRNTQILT